MSDKILETLGKLKAHMESAQEIGSEAEAQAFAARIQQLLAKYKLNMSDVQYSKHLADEPVEEHEFGGGSVWQETKKKTKFGDYRHKQCLRNYPDVEVISRRIGWIEMLAQVITKAYSCDILVSQSSSRLWIVGRKSDAQIAEYLLITMIRFADASAEKDYYKLRRAMRREAGADKELCSQLLERSHGFKASWLRGFTSRLAQRFKDELQKIEQNNTGTALMRLNKEALAVRNYIAGKGSVAKTLNRSSDKFNQLGYNRGQDAANGVSLTANALDEKEIKSLDS